MSFNLLNTTNSGVRYRTDGNMYNSRIPLSARFFPLNRYLAKT